VYAIIIIIKKKTKKLPEKMGMDRVQVVQAKREATQRARRNLCLRRSKERSSHVITLGMYGFS
jgi:hypothetical protein